MSNTIGISTTRVSNLFIYRQLQRQVGYNQTAMFGLQTQLSTGYRISLPSEDPNASGQIIGLQRLLEQKGQVQDNLDTSQSFLTATDSALTSVSSLMTEVRATVMGVLGTTATDTQRETAAQQVLWAIEQLIDTGNQNFRGRYLFSGSLTMVEPFERLDNGAVRYLGNEDNLASYCDVDLLCQTNLPGAEVFGAISESVQGSADMEPVLTYNTRLDDLRGGNGINPGSIQLSNGSQSSIIDISGARTIGDVAAMIRANPPAGSTVNVEITAIGLEISLDAGDLSIGEVGGGTTANELGILAKNGVGPGPVVGDDLDPIVRLTTNLDDLFGVRASAVVRGAGTDNDLIVEADRNGTGLNGVTISFLDDGSVPIAGNEVATYDAGAGTLQVTVKNGYTTAANVIDAINAAYDPITSPLTARLDPLDAKNGGQGLIDVTATGVTRYGSGFNFDQESGIQIRNGGETHTITFSKADGVETVEDLLNAISGAGADVIAKINEAGNGIDIRSRISGSDFAIGENGGTTAGELGLRSFTVDTRLDDLNFGMGVGDYEGIGTVATATVASNGANNNLAFTALSDGTEWNDFDIRFEELVPAGPETLAYDPVAKTMVFGVNSGVTTANDLVDLFNATAGARDDFRITLATEPDGANDGTGTVNIGVAAQTEGGSNADADFTITRSDGVAFEIDIAGAETIGNVLELINTNLDNLATGVPLVARLATVGNGIELVDNNPGGGTLTVTRTALSTAAIGLGLIPPGEESSTTTTGGSAATGTVVFPGADNDLVVSARGVGNVANGVTINFVDMAAGPGVPSYGYDAPTDTLTFWIDPGVTTADAVVTLFQQDPPIDAAAVALFSLGLAAADGTPNDGSGAVGLATATMSGGEPDLLTGEDVNLQETEGLFTALVRLYDALGANDMVEVQRALDMLDESTLDLNFSRAELGSRQQGLEVLKSRLDSEKIELKAALSDEYDADLVETITNLTARQASYEASLKTISMIFGLSLLNYL